MSHAIQRNRLPANPASASAARRWRIGGRVQGVGFRPFVYRLAHVYELTGWVRNTGGEVEIHGEGTLDRLEVFGCALLSRAPPAGSRAFMSPPTCSRATSVSPNCATPPHDAITIPLSTVHSADRATR